MSLRDSGRVNDRGEIQYGHDAERVAADFADQGRLRPETNVVVEIPFQVLSCVGGYGVLRCAQDDNLIADDRFDYR